MKRRPKKAAFYLRVFLDFLSVFQDKKNRASKRLDMSEGEIRTDSSIPVMHQSRFS